MTNNDDITEDLRRDILAGQFAPGDRLVELSLTDRYECGRAAVRSALVELSTEGLVDREANRGATVRRISVAEAIQITEARAALESLIAAKAARHATASQRSELETIIFEMRLAVDRDDPARYSELNRLLHARLRAISCHTVAAHLVENLRNRSTHLQYELAQMPGRPADSLPQHAAIVDAIVRGDEPAAAKAMEEHLFSVMEVLAAWKD